MSTTTTAAISTGLVPEPLGRVHRAAGWALIALGLSIPLFAALLKYIEPEAAGQFIVQGVGSLLLLAGLAWLCTAKLGTRAKANARIVVGLLLGLLVWSSVAAQVKDEAAIKTAIRNLMAYEQRHSAKFADLEARLAQLPLGEVLTPAKLASPQGIEFGRAVVAQMRAHLAERQSLLQSALAEGERLVASMPTERTRQIAQAAMKREFAAGLKFQGDLTNAQTKALAATEEILTWAKARQGTIQAVDGDILFANTADLSKYQALLAKVLAAADIEEKVTAAGTALRAQKEAEQGPARARIAEYLKE